MRNIIKLSITLAVVGIISAVLLTGVHNITSPIITERQEEEYRQALEFYFPEIASYDSEEIGDDYFDIIYDESGNMIGIMGTIEQQGYDGTITYNLAMDESGSIVGSRIVSHSETPGIGDVITTESFQEQFIGKSYEDPIVAGDDVDAVTGATVSSSAMINSIRRVAGVVAENYLGVESVEIDLAEVPDGTYQGSAPGLGGELFIEVEVSGGEIVSIEVTEHSETPTYFVESYPLIPDTIIAEQSLDIDTNTGATVSANAIVEAVENALLVALGHEVEVEEPDEEPPVEVNISEVPDGVYQGAGEGVHGAVVVEVEVAAGEIVSVKVIEQSETPEYFRESNPLIPERIVEEQSLDIDTKTGATITAEAIVDAVNSALLSATGHEGEAETPDGDEEPPVEVNISEVPDGVYQGAGPGMHNMVVVEVEVAAGKIVSVKVVEQFESPEYFRESNPLIPERIVEEQSLDIDTNTGATITADAIVDGVREALLKAIETQGGGGN